MATENIVHIKGDNWKAEVENSDLPVLVDFWAPWCGPCRIVSPILDELSGEYAGRLKFAKVNVDDNQELAGKFGIRSIPTLLIISGGDVKEQIVGAASKAALREKIDASLSD